MPLLGGFSYVQLVTSRDRFGQGNTHLGFAGGDYICTGALERCSVPKMSATDKNTQLRVEEAGLPDDLSCIFDIGTEDEASCRLYACFVESSRP
jgi:hypothetical protein